MTWEYKIVAVEFETMPDGTKRRMTYGPGAFGELPETIDALGADGWELTGIDSSEAESPGSIYIFKRPVR